MQITDIPVKQRSPRKGGAPDTIVIHWSAGSGDEAKLGDYFRRHPTKEASYGYGIGRGGAVARYVPDAEAAWHAGDGAAWDDRRVNDRSIGICLCNLGPVPAEWLKTRPSRVLVARHRKPGAPKGERSWERPTPEQLAALRELIAQLKRQHPSIRFVVGHDDVTKGKIDPGPILGPDGGAAALGLAALGLARPTRRWDLPGQPWEGLEVPKAEVPSGEGSAPQAPASEPPAAPPALEPAAPEPAPKPRPPKAPKGAKAPKALAAAPSPRDPGPVAELARGSADPVHEVEPQDQAALAGPERRA